MARQQDGQVAVGDGAGQRREEVAARERIEGSDGFVQQAAPSGASPGTGRAPPAPVGRPRACRPSGRTECAAPQADHVPRRRTSAGSSPHPDEGDPRPSSGDTAVPPGRGTRRRSGRRRCRRGCAARPRRARRSGGSARRACAAASSCPRRSRRPDRRCAPRGSRTSSPAQPTSCRSAGRDRRSRRRSCRRLVLRHGQRRADHALDVGVAHARTSGLADPRGEPALQ